MDARSMKISHRPINYTISISIMTKKGRRRICFCFCFCFTERLMDKLCSLQFIRRRSTSRYGKGKSHEGDIKFGFGLVKGKADHPIEDYHVARFVEIDEHELGLFAIFDGHFGNRVPSYLQKHLFENILHEDEFWVDPKTSIHKAYERTDEEILLQESELGRGGSTSVTAILINGQRLWVANVGDSRAVVSKGGEAVQMTTDHEPDTDRISIEHRGGYVTNRPGDVARVDGQLAVSRAFGDKSLKAHLRSDPAIQDTKIDTQTDVLVLASDGIWKVMENQEAVDIARGVKDPQKAAKRLIAEALKRRSADDISCVVVRFR